MIEALIALAVFASMFALLYGLASYVHGGRPRCYACDALIPPWSAYCARCLGDPDA